MEDLTLLISQFAERLCFEDLPQKTVAQTRLFVADYFTACIAGYRVNRPFNRALLAVAREEGGNRSASVLFDREKTSVSTAAWVNAAYAHGADMDDGNRKAAGHIGTSVLSAVFAVAEAEHLSWKDVFTAINVGYEVFNRVVAAAMPDLYNKGFHSTGVGGAIACAAACAKAYKLSAKEIYNAVSLAAVQAAGLIIIDESGQSCKPINPANAAKTGVLAAMLARQGISAPRNPLQSKKGWFNAFAQEVDTEEITGQLGIRFTIDESYLKLYPTCRHTHCAMEAAEQVRQSLHTAGVNLAQVEQIRLYVYPAAIRSTGTIRIPKTVDEAKFSLCYCLAVALSKGSFGFGDLECEITPQLEALIEKITFIPTPEMENRVQGIRGAKLEVLSGGAVFESTVLVPKGEGENKLAAKDLRKKMELCAQGVVEQSEAVALVDTILQMDLSQEFVYPELRSL